LLRNDEKNRRRRARTTCNRKRGHGEDGRDREPRDPMPHQTRSMMARKSRRFK